MNVRTAGGSSRKPRILVLADSPLLRAGIRSVLERRRFRILGEGPVDDGAFLRRSRPSDIVVAQCGVADVSRLVARCGGARLLVLAVQPECVQEAMRSGASGYLSGGCECGELVQAVRRIAGGGSYFENADGAPDESLSPREIEVARYVVEGLTNRQIASELGISIRTVETHRANLMRKARVRSAAALVRYAIERGIVDLTRRPSSPRSGSPRRS